MKYSHKKKGKIRIISGYLKGQIIKIKNNNYTRPTTNRIRETLFNWIAEKIKNANCLDCFSGSGSLGIESISRFAKFVTLLESNIKMVYNLKENIKRLKIKNIKIINTNTLKWLISNIKIYDIIFLDPPYKTNKLQKTIFLLNKYPCIQNKGYIYIEKSVSDNIQIPQNWNLIKKKKTKKISYGLYKIKKNIM